MTNNENIKILERLAYQCVRWTGSSWAFIAALGLTLAWIISGPFFHYNESWQLVMNTVSSIVTFLMVFLLQRSQNKDSLAMQIKLNEIIATIEGADNRLISIETLSEDEVITLHKRYQELASLVKEHGFNTKTITAPEGAAQRAETKNAENQT